MSTDPTNSASLARLSPAGLGRLVAAAGTPKGFAILQETLRLIEERRVVAVLLGQPCRPHEILIQYACSPRAWGDLQGFALLLKAGLPVDSAPVGGATILFEAVRRGHVAMTKLLLEAGADPAATHPVNGETLLQVAAHCGPVEMVLLLLEHGAPVNLADQAGVTPAISAAMRCNPSYRLLRALRDAGADFLAKHPSGGCAWDFLPADVAARLRASPAQPFPAK